MVKLYAVTVAYKDFLTKFAGKVVQQILILNLQKAILYCYKTFNWFFQELKMPTQLRLKFQTIIDFVHH